MTRGPKDVAVGHELPPRRVGPLTRLDFARFSVSTDDPNRVHIEEAVAAEAGLPGVIGSGGIVTGILTDLVTSWAGREALRSATFRVTAPLFPGTVVLARGQVVSPDDEMDGAVDVEAVCTDETGNRLGEGRFRLQFEEGKGQ